MYIKREMKASGQHHNHHLRKINTTDTSSPYPKANHHFQSTKMLFSTLILSALTAVSAAGPTAISERRPLGFKFISPYQTYNYNDMKIKPTYIGQVSRDMPPGTQISSLMTYDISSRSLPDTCYLQFSATPKTFKLKIPSDPSKNTVNVDVFSSGQPVRLLNAGNQRDKHLGRLLFDLSQEQDKIVRVENPDTLLGKGFPCPKIGDSNVVNGKVGFEVTIVGEKREMTWDARVNGPYLAFWK